MELRSGLILGEPLGFSEASIPCMICLEEFPESSELHHCSRCTGMICNGCMKNYAISRLREALTVDTAVSVPCPGCRLPHWKPPPTYVAAPGSAFTEDLSFRIEIPRRDRYLYCHGIHDNENFVGFVLLHHWRDYYDIEHSFHIDDIDKLKPFLVPLDATVTKWLCKIITEDDNIEHVAQVFKNAGAHVGATRNGCFWAGFIYKLFLGHLNPF